jgi:Bacterial regulatory proteins, crp family
LRPAFDFLFFGKGLTGFGLLIGTLYSSHTLFALIGCKRSRIIADYLGLTIETVSRLAAARRRM